MLGGFTYEKKRKVIFIKWSKSNVRKYLLSDTGCLSVFHPILFYVYTHIYVCTCYMQMHSNIEQVLFVNFDQFLYYFP